MSTINPSNLVQRQLPYHELVVPLLESTIRAFGEFPKQCFEETTEIEGVPDININRHFCWLVMHIKDGTYRHLTEGTPDEALHSLFTKQLRAKSKLPVGIRKKLNNFGSIEVVAGNTIVRPGATRISKIIKNSLRSTLQESRSSRLEFVIPSPLNIVLDYLTIPEHPGSRAYAFLTLRSFIFERFKLVPDDLNGTDFATFSVEGVESAYSQVLTSFRSRYRSKGQDKMPASGDGTSAMLRYLFAMNGILSLRFSEWHDFDSYCEAQIALPATPAYEFTRPSSLKSLPDLGEVVNSLWGLPIPMRGADTIFRGGLVLSGRGGLVCALHGGPGTGKTSLSLALGATLAGFGIYTIFLTAEETERDLASRTFGLTPDAVRRLPFFPAKIENWLAIKEVPISTGYKDRIATLHDAFERISIAISGQSSESDCNNGVPMPCSTVIVIDGLHDIFAYDSPRAHSDEYTETFRVFVDKCRKLKALVVLTTGDDWESNQQLDYLVDISLSLKHGTEGGSETGSGGKPGRKIHLTKARNQLCAPGVHGFQIAGQKGVRFTPQSNYVLDRLSIHSSKLPDRHSYKKVMMRACSESVVMNIPSESNRGVNGQPIFSDVTRSGVRLYRRSIVFINGKGSGGKAGLALKIAVSPCFMSDHKEVLVTHNERTLVVSFLYPQEYYDDLHSRIQRLRRVEYPNLAEGFRSRVDVIQLYPGHLGPDDLFSRIEWDLRAADLSGDPYTSILIDGMHNVFLQFPEIEKNSIFWPQLINMLRTKDIDIIMTHTVLSVVGLVEDSRSDPLRHALVLKTDFRFDVDPADELDTNGEPNSKVGHAFKVNTQSAIGQPLPKNTAEKKLYWNREKLIFFVEESQAEIQYEFN